MCTCTRICVYTCVYVIYIYIHKSFDGRRQGGPCNTAPAHRTSASGGPKLAPACLNLVANMWPQTTAFTPKYQPERSVLGIAFVL